MRWHTLTRRAKKRWKTNKFYTFHTRKTTDLRAEKRAKEIEGERE